MIWDEDIFSSGDRWTERTEEEIEKGLTGAMFISLLMVRNSRGLSPGQTEGVHRRIVGC